MLKKLFLIAGLLSGIMSAAVFAAPPVGSIEITGGTLLQCTGNVIEGTITPVAYDAYGNPIGSFSATQYFTVSNGGSVSQSASFTGGSSHTFYLSIGSGDVSYAEVYLVSDDNPSARSGIARIHCDGTVEVSGGSGKDARLNYANGDLINALYASTDSTGRGEIEVYSIDSESNGLLEGSFGYELFAPYFDNPPAVNTFLGQINYSRLYALTSGEFQIIVDDPVETGKTYTTIFSAFPVKNVYFR